MPASRDKRFYDMLDAIANTKGDEDAVQQNKRIKETAIAEDAREPTEAELAAIREELKRERHGKWNLEFVVACRVEADLAARKTTCLTNGTQIRVANSINDPAGIHDFRQRKEL